MASRNKPIHRNSYNQIISYTRTEGDIRPYSVVEIPAQKSAYTVTSFNKAIDTVVEELLIPTEDTNLSIIMMNTVTISNTTDTDTTLENNFNWNGEIVQIGHSYGLSNISYYYIENQTYHKLTSLLVTNLVAEKLGKPLFFKIDNEYDYSDDANNQWRYLDNGQHQYIIYDDIGKSPTRMYERKSPGYLNSFKVGKDVVLADILDVDAKEVMLLDIEVSGLISPESPYHMEFSSDTSTRIDFKRRFDNQLRQMIITSGDTLKYKFTKVAESIYTYNINLVYANGDNVNINLPDNLISDSISIGDSVIGEISNQYITPDLKTIRVEFTYTVQLGSGNNNTSGGNSGTGRQRGGVTVG